MSPKFLPQALLTFQLYPQSNLWFQILNTGEKTKKDLK